MSCSHAPKSREQEVLDLQSHKFEKRIPECLEALNVEDVGPVVAFFIILVGRTCQALGCTNAVSKIIVSDYIDFVEAGLRTMTATSEVRRAATLLGISPGADTGTIRSAYLQKVQQWHPDRLERMDPELKEFASQRLSQINLAYETLTNQAGG
jgi:hypothetical protein